MEHLSNINWNIFELNSKHGHGTTTEHQIKMIKVSSDFSNDACQSL